MVALAALEFKQGAELLRAGWCPSPRSQRLRKRQKLQCSQQSSSLTLSWAGVDRRSVSHATQRTQYTVDFHKAPFTGLGLTFAPDPETGEFTVNDIIEDSPAAFSQIRVGDRLRMVSSAFDGGAAAPESHLSAPSRQNERVRFLFERPSVWELRRRVLTEPRMGARVGAATTLLPDTPAAGQSQAGRSLYIEFTRPGQVREERKAIRPKNHSEQVLLLRSLIDEASELPPIPLSPAYQRRWTLEFEGQSLKTHRRLPEDSRWSLKSSQTAAQTSSNIVPLPAFFHGHMSLQSAMQSGAALQRQLQSTQAFCVLPWLVMAPGQLGTKDFETVASACGLTRLLDLDLDSSCLEADAALSGALGASAAAAAEPMALTRSAAALQRLVVRRGGAGMDCSTVELCCILVHTAQNAPETRLSTLLTAWLHWYGRMDMEQAVEEAEKALGCAPDASTIAAASKLLLDRSVERRQRVRLSWPYGGYSVEVAGDVVGGWHVRAPLRQCPTSACSSIELRGLEPGAHRYKFIVDGMWVVDMALPAECDSEGNTNNVVHVPDCSAASLSPAESLSHVRLEAARLALNTKLGVSDRRQ
ncbi:probable 5'-AMP-activated protein kinase subunit beta-2 at C-terminar half [Coccomyxa sp. Obi]|nr:probable 5'-AMP-activated protein kinase subunit beta-2 at C-terminar half [Coccomyxa sp. Obi]